MKNGITLSLPEVSQGEVNIGTEGIICSFALVGDRGPDLTLDFQFLFKLCSVQSDCKVSSSVSKDNPIVKLGVTLKTQYAISATLNLNKRITLMMSFGKGGLWELMFSL